jgi:DNA transposition AAA+ family ATPase
MSSGDPGDGGRAVAPGAPEPGFVVTSEYRRFAEFCAACSRYRYIGLCYGVPGVGKTLSARRYAQWDLVEPLFPTYAYTDAPLPVAATCRTVLYTPPVASSPARIAAEVAIRRNRLSWLVGSALQRPTAPAPSGAAGLPPPVDYTELVIVDEADRLRMAGLEQVRDLYDRAPAGLVLLGMPGLERRLARYPQLYSRVGFVHQFRTLSAAETRTIVHGQAHRLGVALEPAAFADAEAVAAIIRVTGGNFRLLQRLLQQVERVLEINGLPTVTVDAVTAARESLVIGAA